MTIMFLAVLLIACTNDQDGDGIELDDSYSMEQLIANIGDNYSISFEVNSDDEVMTYTLARDGEFKLYLYDASGFLFTDEVAYSLDLDAETKTEYPAEFYDVLVEGFDASGFYIFGWADLVEDVLTFVKNDTFIGRSVKVYEFSITDQGETFATRFYIDAELKIALKYEYESNESDGSWEVTAFQVDDVDLSTYMDFETEEE